MNARTAVVTLLSLAGASCGSGDVTQARAATTEAVQDPLTYPVDASGPRRPISYSWNGRSSVPFNFVEGPNPSSDGGRVRVPSGEAGLTPETRFYVTFNEGAGERVLDVSDARRPGTQVGCEWVQGRYGNALRFPTPEARVAFEPGRGTLLEGDWSVEFWIDPETEQEESTILDVPNGIAVRIMEDMLVRVIAQLDESWYMTSSVPLEPGVWNHVGLALDHTLNQIRVVVNGEVSAKPIEGVQQVVGATEVLVGGFVGKLDELVLTSHPAATCEFVDRWTQAPRTGTNRLALRLADGTEEVSVWYGLASRPLLRTEEDLEQGELEHVVADGERLVWASGNWTRHHPASPPWPRTTHPTVYVGDHRVWIWGGETRDSHRGPMVNTDDTWIYRTDEDTWTRVPTGVQPGPACHQAAAYSPDHDVVLYAGGWRNDAQGPFGYSTTWLYHVDEGRWEERHPGGAPFPSSSDAHVVYHARARKFVCVMAAYGMMVYDPEADTWERLPPPQVVYEDGTPSDYQPGGSPIAGYDPVSEDILIFGGAVMQPDKSKVYHDRTARYDYDTNTLTELRFDEQPSPRVRSGFAYDSRRARFVLFGGVKDQYSQRMEDLWTFDMKTNEWTRHLAANLPSRRGGYYDMAYDPDLDRCYLIAGRHSPTIFLNDVWSLHMDDRAVGTARYVFDRAQLHGCSQWYAQWRQPGDSDCRLRFRGSADLVAWDDWTDSPVEVLSRDVRYVQVEATLAPGTNGEVPELRMLGFLDDASVVESEPGEDVRHMLDAVQGLR